MGVFSSVENVHVLLREHELTSIVKRSEARQARLTANSDASGPRLTRPAHSVVTPTEAKREASIPQP